MRGFSYLFQDKILPNFLLFYCVKKSKPVYVLPTFLHHRPQNSGNKVRNAKKRKCTFDFKISAIKKAENACSAYTQSTYLIFGMVKDADNIYCYIKNQVRRLCVGGNMAILLLVSSSSVTIMIG